MIDWLGKQDAQVIEVDTDGIYFVPPADVARASGLRDAEKIAQASSLQPEGNQRDAGSTAAEQLRSELAKELPPGIEVEFDEQFEAMFSYKAKNYALLTHAAKSS